MLRAAKQRGAQDDIVAVAGERESFLEMLPPSLRYAPAEMRRRFGRDDIAWCKRRSVAGIKFSATWKKKGPAKDSANRGRIVQCLAA